MSEHEEQVVVVEWAALMSGQVHELALLYAIPNGAKLPYSRHVNRAGKVTRWAPEAVKLKEEGMRPGVPDLCLPVARGGYHGLYIELKFGKNKPTPEQVAYLDALAAQGYLAVVCWGAADTIEAISEYLAGSIELGI